MTDSPSLYASRKQIFPKYQPGFFRSLRWYLTGLFLGIYYLLPFLRWDRGAGIPDQAILFDLPGRKFYLFGLVVWPQEVYLLAFLLIAAAFGLFFITALAGRIFCGYMCFQTVWTDLFLLVELWTEGHWKKRQAAWKSPWTLEKGLRKLLKHILWVVISVATGGAFVFYFADAPSLLREFLDGSAAEPAWFTLGFLTLTTYVMAGFAREQVCIYMCPYARFQGAMFDEETLIVAYHPELGEPRESNRRRREAADTPTGHCIDCGECVAVCPTGIDIRHGQQYQCITCAACIDACDSVMARMKDPTRLIRYTSLSEINGKKAHLLRPRTFVYGALLAAAFVAISLHFVWRAPVELNVLRHRNPLYIRLTDGGIQNNYTVHLLNLTSTAQKYTLQVENLPGAILTQPGQESGGNGLHLEAKAGEVVPYTVFLRLPPQHTRPGSTDITFRLTGSRPESGEASYQSKFMGPHDD
ncbi:MAG: cytochrome c oxidase accessory protein CcoG [Magnetococcales bacterium]|nr:cytochrome c oxidase accessory protein CcoG [Magnetococcales bacterium]